jgi:hypothetical protein
MKFKVGDRIWTTSSDGTGKNWGTIKGAFFNSINQDSEYTIKWDNHSTECTYSSCIADLVWTKKDCHLNDALKYALEPLAMDNKDVAQRMAAALGQADISLQNLKKDSCNHEWVWYNGFTEQFEFCNKCDKKKR